MAPQKFCGARLFYCPNERVIFLSHEKYPAPRPPDPFGDSAPERLRRMGLLTAEGRPDKESLAVVSRLYAGVFYDDLYDFYSDMRIVNSVCRDLVDLLDMEEDVRPPFLSICSAYEAIYCALPAPVWWMAGNLELAARFADGSLRRLSEFTEGSGVM